MGLIRGASLENAVCFTRDGALNPEGLRSADECCRHKALDLIGDLALIGPAAAGARDRGARGSRDARGAGRADYVGRVAV